MMSDMRAVQDWKLWVETPAVPFFDARCWRLAFRLRQFTGDGVVLMLTPVRKTRRAQDWRALGGGFFWMEREHVES